MARLPLTPLTSLFSRQGGIARAFSNRPYRIYTSGNFVSLVGTWVQRVAVGWLTWDLTGSGAWLGLIAAAEFLPSIVAGPLGGAIADRLDRIKVTWVCQILLALQAAVLGILTLTGLISPWLLFGLTAFLGFVTGFNQPARLSLVPVLVRAEDIPAAVAVNSVLWNGARFVGPALAGVLIVGLGVGWAFLVNALSFVAFLVSLARLDLKLAARPMTAGVGLIGQIREGVVYVARHPALGPLTLLLFMGSVWARPFAELLPGFADAVFGRGADGLAMLTAATGVGAMIGGVWMSQRGRLDGSTALAIGSTLLMALTLLLFVATAWFPLGLLAVGAAGLGMVVNGVAMQSLIQASTEPGMLGRVLSIYGMSFRAGPALGALIMGGMSKWMGLRPPVAIGAVICIVAWWWLHRRRRRIIVLLERVGPKRRARAAALTPGGG